jgi:hypothetical protein
MFFTRVLSGFGGGLSHASSEGVAGRSCLCSAPSSDRIPSSKLNKVNLCNSEIQYDDLMLRVAA